MTIRQAYEAIARDQLRKHDIHPTGASMTFQEWFEENKHYLDGLSAEAALRCVWGDATAAERERCARIAEGIERPGDRHWIKGSLYDMLRRDIAAEIRRNL